MLFISSEGELQLYWIYKMKKIDQLSDVKIDLYTPFFGSFPTYNNNVQGFGIQDRLINEDEVFRENYDVVIYSDIGLPVSLQRKQKQVVGRQPKQVEELEYMKGKLYTQWSEFVKFDQDQVLSTFEFKQYPSIQDQIKSFKETNVFNDQYIKFDSIYRGNFETTNITKYNCDEVFSKIYQHYQDFVDIIPQVLVKTLDSEWIEVGQDIWVYIDFEEEKQIILTPFTIGLQQGEGYILLKVQSLKDQNNDFVKYMQKITKKVVEFVISYYKSIKGSSDQIIDKEYYQGVIGFEGFYNPNTKKFILSDLNMRFPYMLSQIHQNLYNGKQLNQFFYSLGSGELIVQQGVEKETVKFVKDDQLFKMDSNYKQPLTQVLQTYVYYNGKDKEDNMQIYSFNKESSKYLMKEQQQGKFQFRRIQMINDKILHLNNYTTQEQIFGLRMDEVKLENLRKGQIEEYFMKLNEFIGKVNQIENQNTLTYKMWQQITQKVFKYYDGVVQQ